MKTENHSFINWSQLVEQKEDLKDWIDWAFRGVIASSLVLAISYVRSMSQDINQIAMGMVELRADNRSAQVNIQDLKNRLERLEQRVFFEKKP